MSDTRTKKQKIGDIGEDIACRFLVKRGFRIVDRNYRKKWGEIDVVAEKNKSLHFIEVKTGRVSPETENIRPEEHVTPNKLKRLYRAIATYLEDKNVSGETDWVIDVLAIDLNVETKEAHVRFLKNVITE